MLALILSTTALRAAQVIETDICVYGGTSGGVTAAVAAARLGKSVALISLNNHVGGMTASGLGVTDIGPGNDTSYVTGISREFYKRVGAAYGSSNLVIWFEPHVAENVFNQMLVEAGVPVYPNKLLASATLVSNRITQITMEDGTVFRAKQFIDTTYEGDLMAAAGVTFTWGREGTNVFNESLAGIRAAGGTYNYDPYVIPGNTNSGLLPLVNTNTVGIVGAGDQRLQAYNFRLCLTQNATNKIPITAPVGYSEANYELVRRYLNARVATNGSVLLNQLIHVQQIIPNGKTDINANGELSTDYVGYNYTWATNTYAGRAVIRQQHEDYIRGLLYFFGNSTNVPLNVRTEMQTWGLAADEFTDNGGWPWQIYVREARRMQSGYIMTQSNCESRVTAPDGICLARYQIDSHGVQRVATGGFSRWEGSIGGTPPYPYPVSYRSIIPRSNECQNVFSTFALSASHVAFASCRMEPVFMMTSHAAGVAAAFAIDDNVAVQQLNYAKLSAQLRADGQLLSWAAAGAATNGIILDENDPAVSNSGGWALGANAGGWGEPTDYFLDNAAGKGTKWVNYTPTLPTNGTYEVYAWWVESSNRATNTPYDIIHASGTNRVLVNQKVSSGGWFKLMTTNFNAGTNGRVIIRNDNTAVGAYCVADGVRWLGLGAAAPVVTPTVEVVASDAVGGVFLTNAGRFSIVRSDTNGALTVNYAVGGTATPGVNYLALPASVTLSAGVAATNLAVIPLGNSLSADQLTVTLGLLASPSYVLTSVSNATVTLRDRPLNIWYRANPGSGGDTDDAEGDRLPNLVEYALGLSPTVPDANPFSPVITNNHFQITFSKSKTAVDVTLTPEWSPDLLNWFSGAPYLIETLNLDAGSIQWITLQSGSPVSSNNTGFIRVRAARN